jgi:hypothetical protein
MNMLSGLVLDSLGQVCGPVLSSREHGIEYSYPFKETISWILKSKDLSRIMFYGVSWSCIISGFCREVDEIWAPLDYHAAYSCNSLPRFRENLSVPSSRVKKSKNKTLEYGTGRLSWNVVSELPVYAA